MWRMEQGGPWPPVLGRAQEPPLSSRWSLLIGTGYNCRRPLAVVHRVAGLEPIGTWGPPPAPAFVLLAVLGGGRSGSGMHGRSKSHRLEAGGILTHTPSLGGLLTHTPPRLAAAPPVGLEPPPERASSPIRPKGVELAFKLITFSIPS